MAEIVAQIAHPVYHQSEADIRELALVNEFLGGDDKAFLQLYARYEAPLLVYCRKMCNEDRTAEDSFQETWMRIYELRQRTIEVQHFQSLLFRTARNVCYNRLRKEQVRSRGRVDIDEDTLSISEIDKTEQDEVRALLTRALGKLPIEQREVFILHEYSGFGYTDISQILGRSESSVKMQAFRARMRLRQLVAGWLGLASDDDPLHHSPFKR
jgi:RNA polymerase sigma-70 factor, ECF subfamily